MFSICRGCLFCDTCSPHQRLLIENDIFCDDFVDIVYFYGDRFEWSWDRFNEDLMDYGQDSDWDEFVKGGEI